MVLLDRWFALIQRLLPQRAISRLANALARVRLAPVKNLQIGLFGLLAGVDWSEARERRIAAYADFNAFFTRDLVPGARPLDPDPQAFVSPCDGRISQCGRLTSDRLLQAKGLHYALHALLANDAQAGAFANGYFHTLYLAPGNYHRVHMPLAGDLQRMIHVPGRLFSVGPATVRTQPDLFTRNERVIALFSTGHGPMALVLVGIVLVSGIETVWSGPVTVSGGGRSVASDWSRRAVHLARGAEMGRFNFGSTVILLLPAAAVATLAELGPDDVVQVGQRLGRLR